MTNISNLVRFSIAKVKFHKAATIGDMIHALAASPALEEFVLQDITMPISLLRELPTSKIHLPNLERLALRYIDNPFIHYLLDRICARASVRIAISANATPDDTLEAFFSKTLIKSPSISTLRHAKIAIDELVSGETSVRIHASATGFDDAVDAACSPKRSRP